MRTLVNTWWVVVVHTSWQAAFVGAAALLGVWALRRRTPTLRYALLVVALVKFAMPPMTSFPTGVFSRVQLSRPSRAPDMDLKTDEQTWKTEPGDIASAEPADVPPLGRLDGDAPPWMSDASTSSSFSGEDIPESLHADAGEPVSEDSDSRASRQAARDLRPWLAGVHLLGSAIMVGWVVSGLLRIRRLHRQCRPVEAGPLHDQFVALGKRLGLRRPVRLLLCPDDHSPVAFGLARPTVVVPSSLADRLPSGQAAAVLAHELAHHKRRDTWIIWLENALLVVWWFHPVLWALVRTIRKTREACCDDLVLERGAADREAYCRSLIEAASRLASPPRMHAALGFAETLHPLGNRLKRIMDVTSRRSVRLSLVGLLSMVVVALAVLPGLGIAASEEQKEKTKEKTGQVRFSGDGRAGPAATEPLGKTPFHRPTGRFVHEAKPAPILATKDGRAIVSAMRMWSDTGIDLDKGQTVEVSANGQVRGCRGPRDQWAYGPWGPEGMLHKGKRCFALIGKIEAPSGEQAFYIGKDRTFEAPESGRFYLGVSDVAYFDNDGAFLATVQVDGKRIDLAAIASEAPSVPEAPTGAKPTTTAVAVKENEQKAYPWVVFGRVTDGTGRGLRGVTVRASCGRGTLRPTGKTTTDADGNYRLTFGPAKVVVDEAGHVDISKTVEQTVPQAAIIAPSKPGYYERNLRRQGDLRLARELPGREHHDQLPPDRTVLPNKPKRVDFVMLPAASVAGLVIDENGKAVVGRRFYLDGHELVPAASVLTEFRPDQNGEFALLDVPLKSYWFTPADGDLRELKSNVLTFSKPGTYVVELTFDRAKRELAARIVPMPNPIPVPTAVSGKLEIRGTVMDAPDFPKAFDVLEDAQPKSDEQFHQLLERTFSPPPPAPNAVVTLRGHSMTKTTHTDAEGNYRFAGLPGGNYEVSAQAPSRPTATKGVTRTATAKGRVKLSRHNRSVRLRLSAMRVAIKGRITDAHGKPVAGAKVTAVAVLDDPSNMRKAAEYSTGSDADGFYELQGMNPHNWYHLAGHLAGGKALRQHVDIRVEADGFEQAKESTPRVPLVTEDVLILASRLLKIFNRWSKNAGRPVHPEKQGLTFPSSKGNTITGIDIVLDRAGIDPRPDAKRGAVPEVPPEDVGIAPKTHARPPGSHALWFDGKGDHIHVQHSPSLALTDACTLEAWVCFQQGGTLNPRIVSKGWDRQNGFEFATWGIGATRKLNFGMRRVGDFASSAKISANEWHHVAVTYDADNVCIYLDGKATDKDLSRGPLARNDTALNIGRNSQTKRDLYRGAIDEVRIWNVARTADEIRASMNLALAGDEPGLVAYWDFEEGQAQTVKDRSGKGNDGRLGDADTADRNDPFWITPDGKVLSSHAEAQAGSKEPGATAHQSDLAAFFDEVDRTYPFFDLKGIRADWAAAKPRLAERATSCRSDTEFLGIVRDAIGCLRDSHMRIRDAKAKLPPWPKKYYPGLAFMPATDNRVVVMWAAKQYVDRLKPGMVVTKIDGKDARKYLEGRASEAWKEGYNSSPQRARLYAYRIPLKGEKGQTHTLSYLTGGSGTAEQELVATCEMEARGWPHFYHRPQGLTRVGRSLSYTKLAGGAGYMYLRYVDGNTHRGIAQAIGAHPDAKGWILDLRGNGGGGYDRSLHEAIVRIPKPVAVLIDAGCTSAGETLARDLRREASARLFGSKTAGSSSSKRSWTFPSGIASVTFSTRSRWRGDRKPIEFNGIEPDVKVEAVPEEVRQGLNSGILRAEEYVANASAKPGAG